MSALHEQVSEALIDAVTEADGKRPELTDEDKVELAKLTGTLVALYAADLREQATWHDEQAAAASRELDLWTGKRTGFTAIPGSQFERDMDMRWSVSMERKTLHEKSAERLRVRADELSASPAVAS